MLAELASAIAHRAETQRGIGPVLRAIRQTRIDRPVDKRRASHRFNVLCRGASIVLPPASRHLDIRSWPTKRPTQFVFFSPSGTPAFAAFDDALILRVEGRIVGPRMPAQVWTVKSG